MYLQQNNTERILFSSQSSIYKTGTVSYTPVQFHQVFVSTDCGQTFTEVYNKSGNPVEANTLPTRSDTAGYWKPW